jgi:hypothetical protein
MVYDVLEVLTQDGKKTELGRADIPTLRFLATHLRRALHVPARSAETDRLDPVEIAYHLQDDLNPPAVPRLTLHQTPDATVLTKPPMTPSEDLFGLFLLDAIFTLSALILCYVLLPRVAANDDVIFTLMFIGIATLLAIFSLLCTIVELSDTYLFLITPSELTYTRKNRVYRGTQSFSRDSIVAVRSTPFRNNTRFCLRLFLPGQTFSS